MSGIQNSLPKVLIGVVAPTMTSAALAQPQRSSVDAAASSGVPEFRDPKTGQVWTPETVGQDGRPLTGPDDKAFDPSAQSVPAKTAEQRVRGRPVGSVPITAGPTVPIVVMRTTPRSEVVPGQRWRAVVVPGQQQRQPGRAGDRLSFHQRQQHRDEYARARSADRRRRAPGPRHLRSEVGRLR